MGFGVVVHDIDAMTTNGFLVGAGSERFLPLFLGVKGNLAEVVPAAIGFVAIGDNPNSLAAERAGF